MASAGAARRREAVVIAAVLLLALGLRLYHLDAQSLWNDEGTSVALAQRDLATIARHASYDIHPPLYYFLLHGWVAVAGTSEAAVRSLSMLAGVALVAGVWALARRLSGPTVAALAALLAAVAPFQVHYSQEARMYIWAALFALLATIAFERLLRGGDPLTRASPPSSRASARDLDSLNASPAAEDGGAPDPASARDLDVLDATPAAGDDGAPGRAPASPQASPPSSRALARDLDALDATPVAEDGATLGRVAPTALYALAAIAAIYSHYLGATVLVAHNLAFLAWWAWRWRSQAEWGRAAAWRALAGWALLQGFIVLAYVPWLAVSWRSLRNWPAVSADFSVAAMLGDALRVSVWGPAAEAGRAATAAALGVAALALPGVVGLLLGDLTEQDKVPRHTVAPYTRGNDASASPGASSSAGGDVSSASRSLATLGTTTRAHAPERRRPRRQVSRPANRGPSLTLGTTEGTLGTAEEALGAATPRWFGAVLLGLYLVTPIALMALASLGRPMYKTKFVLLATPPLYVLVAAGAVALGRWAARLTQRRVVSAMVIGLVMLGALAPAAKGLARVYWDESTYRDDYRGMAAYIAATAGPNDAILINAPSQVETFGYYYRGPLPWYPLPRQRPIDAEDARDELEAMAARHDRIYAVLWATNESDPERVIEGWLDDHAFKAMDRWFGDVRLAMWAMPRSTEGAVVEPAGYALGDALRLDGYSVLTPEPTGGDVLQVALHWEALAPVAVRYKVFVHLVDAAGVIVAQRDSEPGGGARLTTGWAPGEGVTDLYGLLIPPDTPPGDHVLRVGMYALDGGERLPVTLDGQPIGDAIDLTRLHVGEGNGTRMNADSTD